MDTQVTSKHDFFIVFKAKLPNSLDVFCFVQTSHPIHYRHMDIAFICIFNYIIKYTFNFPSVSNLVKIY